MERKDLCISFLSELLRFKTISASSSDKEKVLAPEEFRKAFSFIENEARRLGLEFRNHEGMAAMVEWKTGRTRMRSALHAILMWYGREGDGDILLSEVP